jgi:shikimate dehydrogenase
MPKKRAVIIGKDVSKGARSPILWNAAYKSLGIEAEMVPVDIDSEADAYKFLEEQIQNNDFVGGAVAAPLKEVVANFFAPDEKGFIEPKNCFFKSKNIFTAKNTDTLALLESIYREKNKNEITKIAVLGTGGVAKSLCYQLSTLNNDLEVDVYGRSNDHLKLFSNFNTNFKNYVDLKDKLSSYEVLINCTSVGKDGADNTEILSREQLQQTNPNVLIFDVNYINSPSKLIRDAQSLSLNSIDGSRMNLMQAVIGFCLANDMEGQENIVHRYMLEALS